MKNKMKVLYDSGKINMDGLLSAILKGWITVEDAAEIVGEFNEKELALSAKLSEISVACNQAIVSGVDLTFNDEPVHFNLSIEDQANISNLFRVVELGCKEYPYQADGGICRIYTAAEIAQIYLAAQSTITYHTTYHNILKSYLKTLTDVEEIRSAFYGMELPETYQKEMTDKLAVAQQQVESITAKIGA